MGYESRLIVAFKTKDADVTCADDHPMFYAQRIATFDLGKMGEEFKSVLCAETAYYVYADDGNTRLIEDEYGDALREVDPVKLWNFSEGLPFDDYRRRLVHPAALYSMWLTWSKDLLILHYGY